MRWAVTVAAVAATVALAACSMGAGGSPGPVQPICSSGDAQSCACAGGGDGVRTCVADGSGFGPCQGCPDDSCAAPSVRCASGCTSTDSDPENCGACGNACMAGRSCTGGVCACAASEARCDGDCVDLQTDGANCGACGLVCGSNTECVDGSCAWRGTNVEHVVLVVQENHTFDSYFGRYCTAPAGSSPTCTVGRACCEGAPGMDRAGNGGYVLDDVANYGDDHDHGYLCEVCEIDGGLMDRFTDDVCPNDFSTLAGLVTDGCSSPKNFAVATDAALMNTYWSMADNYALADRYFQPIAGGTSGNDMYFAVTHYEFADNDATPAARGAGCTQSSSPTMGMSFLGRTTIADVLLDGGFTFGVYADGYADAYDAYPDCPPPGGDCRESISLTERACKYDPSDIPFQYYPRFTDDRTYMHDLSDLYTDLSAGTLPSFSYVKYRTSGNEHPEWSYISDGENNVAAVMNAILAAPKYQSNTLVLLTWDESGGFYDHVTPPPSIEVFPAGTGTFAGTPVPYGPRVPMLAVGAFARRGHVSHTVMEHSSIVAFLEWNFLGPDAVGAIRATDHDARDGLVNNLGSMLDPNAVGVAVP